MVMNVKEKTMKIKMTLPPDNQNSASPKTLMARTLRILMSQVSKRTVRKSRQWKTSVSNDIEENAKKTSELQRGARTLGTKTHADRERRRKRAGVDGSPTVEQKRGA
jgi:hypothetical protein